MPLNVLTIAGFDPSSGAGITADIKTIAAHGCYGVACITAYTVQSTQGVKSVEPVAPGLVLDTLECLVADMDIAAVRIGMLGSSEVVRKVADFLSWRRLPNVVLDPVVLSSSGASLLQGREGLEIIRGRLVPLSAVITPNLYEAAVLTGLPVRSLPEMETAAERLRELGAANVVVTGGHLDEPIDVLSSESGIEHFRADHIQSRSTHGTGCAFATALACNLANGRSVRDAVFAAKQYVREGIEKAYPVGKGTGPLNHLHGVMDPR
jgi:hydroxymethylpyrimidine/phosphomethylpyrimidine kinase